jgi:hypothetical protein
MESLSNTTTFVLVLPISMPAIIFAPSFGKLKMNYKLQIVTAFSLSISQEEPVSLGLSDSASESPIILNARTVKARQRPGYIAIHGA